MTMFVSSLDVLAEMPIGSIVLLLDKIIMRQDVLVRVDLLTV